MEARTAFLFPGQGSVFPRMGEDLCEAWPAARSAYDAVSRASGVDVAALSFGRDQRRLAEVDGAHLAILAHSLAVHAVLEDHGAVPDFVAGHSLGELCAAAAAGAVSLEEGARLAKRRGELLRECCARNRGGMVAVQGTPLPVIEEVLEKVGRSRVIRIANWNGRDEVVLSGEEAGLREAMRGLRSRGANLRPLAVAGAFHSPLMESAAKAFAQDLDGADFLDPRIPIVSSSTGEVLTAAGGVREELKRQILSPVRWDLAMERLTGLGVDRWIEVGPGKVLTGFIQRVDRRAQAYPTSTSGLLASACESLGRIRKG